jgi:hypothetical protein
MCAELLEYHIDQYCTEELTVIVVKILARKF